MKYAIIILIEIELNVLISLCSMEILMMLIFAIHEHSVCFHLLYIPQFLLQCAVVFQVQVF